MSIHSFWPASRLAAAIQKGELSAVDALEGCIERIEHFDGALNAVCVRLFDEARDRARAADEAQARGDFWGPLHGVPVTVKEAYDVAGTPTTWGLAERANHIAETDSEAVRGLRAAGAVILGKTNVATNLQDWQSNNALYGRTNNPWNLARTPGGSSGGSAVSMAVGYAYLEAGSDIGGSLRNPAHFCGICAHKPTFGIVPDTGHRIGDPEQPIDLLVCGPMSRSAKAGAAVDCNAALPFDSRAAHRVYLGLLRGALSTALSDAEFEEELQLATSLGADDESYRALIARAFVQRHRAWLAADTERLAIRRAWSSFFESYDVLLCPIAPTPAWAHDPRDRFDRLIDVDGTGISYFDQIFWSGVPILSYLPATTIPAGRSDEGLPVGVQIVAEYLEDRTALNAARLIEAETEGFVPPPAFASVD